MNFTMSIIYQISSPASLPKPIYVQKTAFVRDLKISASIHKNM